MVLIWRRFVQSFRYALAGIIFALRHEPNLRFHCTAAGLVALLTVWLELAAVQAAVLALAIFLVIVSELINTAIEKTVDLCTSEYHSLAAAAKNTAAGAVLLAALNAIICGALILGPPLWSKIMTW